MKRPARRRSSARRRSPRPATHLPGTFRTRRVLLFCPATDERKLRKAATLQADGVIIDLEDSVALGRKEEARHLLRRTLDGVDFGRSERLVRVNPEGSGLEEDVRAAAAAARPPDAFVLPKVESARGLQRLSDLLSALERRRRLAAGTFRVLAIVETALGVVRLQEIATGGTRLEALLFGAEDLCGDLGGVRTREGREVLVARTAVALHAAARRLQAIDTPFMDLEDEAGLRSETREALTFGYTGKLAIHPRQVAPILEAFTPTSGEIEQARRLIEEHDRRQAAGTGVFALDGRMVDMPMVRAARAVLARARLAGLVPSGKD